MKLVSLNYENGNENGIMPVWRLVQVLSSKEEPANCEYYYSFSSVYSVGKLAVVQRFLDSKLGAEAIQIDVNPLVAAAVVLKGLGGFLFVFGSTFGAYLMFITWH